LATHELPDAQTAAIVPPDGVTSNNLNDQPPGFYATRRAEQIADNLLAYQRPVGGWSKNVDMVNNSNWHYLDENTSLPYFTTTDPYSTLDNDATHVQLQFLGRVISAGNRSPRFMEAFFRGLRYVLRAQYLSGGFPQFIEPRRTATNPPPGYWNNITINDDAMASVMELLEDIYQKEWHMSFVAEDPEMYKAVTDARNRAIECMLRSQQKVRGVNIRPHDQLEAFEWLDEFPPGGMPDEELTVWCQQHDPVTLGSARGRNYEVRCLAGMESASIIQLLMRIPNPGPRIKYAVHASVAWYRRTAKVGYMQERIYDQRLMRGSVRQDFPTGDPNNMVWNRFYELLTGSDPLFVGRDIKITWDIYDLTTANRDTYMNIHNRGEALFPAYEEWVTRPSNPDFPEFDGLPEMTWPGMPSNLEVDRERKLTWQQLRDLGEI
jgi:pectinesterase